MTGPASLPLQLVPRADTDWRPAIASALLAAALFAVTLGGTFIYDDLYIIGIDKRIRDPSLWYQFWTRDYFNGGADNLYRPLVSMSYAIQWQLHGDRPLPFHLVNVLLHALASAGVAELARRLAGTTVAFVAGLLFAAHPVHVEAVANVVGRAELACGAAVAWALVLFARRPFTTGRAVGIWCLLVVAMLSKEQGLLLPAMLLVIHLLGKHGFLGEPGRPRVGDRPALRTLLLLVCWTMAAYIVFRESILKFWWDRAFLDWTQNPMVRAEGLHRWLMPLVLLGRYTLLLVAPYKLSIDYGGSVIGWQARPDDPFLYLGVAALVAWIALLLVALARCDGRSVFCLLCLGMVYGLVGNIVTIIGTNFGERLMYLPSAFFLILVGLWLSKLPRPALTGAMAVQLALACTRSVTYAARWNDRLAFHESSVRAQPKSVRVHLLLCDEQIRRKDYAAAEETMARAREVQPDYAKVWLQSAVVALLRGDPDRAEALATRAQEIDISTGSSAIWKEIATYRATTRPASSTTASQPAP